MTRSLKVISNILLAICIVTFAVNTYYVFLLTAPFYDVVAFHGGMLTISYQMVCLWESCYGASAAVAMISGLLGVTVMFLGLYSEYLDECELY